MSFGSLSGNADRGAQPRRRAGRLPAEHRRGRRSRRTTATAATSSSRSAPATSAAATSDGRFDLAAAQGPGRRRAGAGDRDQAVARAPSRPRRRAARREGHPGDRRDPRHPARATTALSPSPAHRVPRRRLDARLRRAARRRDRAAGRHQVGGRRPGRSGTSSPRRWRDGERGVDFVTIDGGEGGTGAAPLVFTDHVALPVPARLRAGLPHVRRRPGSPTTSRSSAPASSGSPRTRVVAFALGCDMVNVAREAMLSIGCIQAQRCHTDHCPTGVATQNPWLMRGLDPTLKSVRARNYVRTLRRDLLKVSEAVGVAHPGLITPDDVDILDGVRSRAVRCGRGSTATPPGDRAVLGERRRERGRSRSWRRARAAAVAQRPRHRLTRPGRRPQDALGRAARSCRAAGRTSSSSSRNAVGPGRDVVLPDRLAHRPHPARPGPSASAR